MIGGAFDKFVKRFGGQIFQCLCGEDALKAINVIVIVEQSRGRLALYFCRRCAANKRLLFVAQGLQMRFGLVGLADQRDITIECNKKFFFKRGDSIEIARLGCRADFAIKSEILGAILVRLGKRCARLELTILQDANRAIDTRKFQLRGCKLVLTHIC